MQAGREAPTRVPPSARMTEPSGGASAPLAGCGGLAGPPEFDTKCAKCLISLRAASKVSLQEGHLRVRAGLSEMEVCQ